LYAVLTVATVFVLRLLARAPLPRVPATTQPDDRVPVGAGRVTS